MTEVSLVSRTEVSEKEHSSDVKEASSGLLEWESNFFSGQEISKDLRQEISNRIKVRKINDMWVCFVADEIPEKDTQERIAWAHHQTEFLSHFVENPKTLGVMIEYFAPELKHRARNSSLLAKPFIESNLNTSRYRDRVFGFNYLARLAKQNHKDVFVADIANKPAYQALRMGWGYAPGALAAAASTRPNSPLTLAMTLFGGGIWSAIAQETISRVTPNKNKLEVIIPTPEDARRVFVAEGVQEITAKLAGESEQNKGKTVLVIYPEAHINRIIDYIDKGSKKKSLYKVALPGLDYFVRRYRANSEFKKSSDNAISGWELIEKIPL